MMRVVRRRLVVVVVVLAVSFAVVVVALASTTTAGLPAYTNGYAKWTRLNAKPIRGGSSAHSGVKNVYVSKARVRGRFPEGTVVVKTIAQPGDRKGAPSQVAVMRKRNGRWTFVEFSRAGARYSLLAQGQLCVSCHMQAKKTDYVFTR
jgi:hypothetical protein